MLPLIYSAIWVSLSGVSSIICAAHRWVRDHFEDCLGPSNTLTFESDRMSVLQHIIYPIGEIGFLEVAMYVPELPIWGIRLVFVKSHARFRRVDRIVLIFRAIGLFWACSISRSRCLRVSTRKRNKLRRLLARLAFPYRCGFLWNIILALEIVIVIGIGRINSAVN